MPHDSDGRELKVGDVVHVPCIITAIQPTNEYCNVNMETIEPMFPGTYKSTFTLNAKQVLLFHRPPNE